MFLYKGHDCFDSKVVSHNTTPMASKGHFRQRCKRCYTKNMLPPRELVTGMSTIVMIASKHNHDTKLEQSVIIFIYIVKVWQGANKSSWAEKDLAISGKEINHSQTTGFPWNPNIFFTFLYIPPACLCPKRFPPWYPGSWAKEFEDSHRCRVPSRLDSKSTTPW